MLDFSYTSIIAQIFMSTDIYHLFNDVKNEGQINLSFSDELYFSSSSFSSEVWTEIYIKIWCSVISLKWYQIFLKLVHCGLNDENKNKQEEQWFLLKITLFFLHYTFFHFFKFLSEIGDRLPGIQFRPKSYTLEIASAVSWSGNWAKSVITLVPTAYTTVKIQQKKVNVRIVFFFHDF